MDKNKLTAILAHKLEESGVEKGAAIAEARSFVRSISDDDAAKLTAISGNDAMMSKIVSSLKKKAETSHLTTPAPVKREVPVQDETPANREVPEQREMPAPVKREAQIKEYGTAPRTDARPVAPIERAETPETRPDAPSRQTARPEVSANRARPLPQKPKLPRPVQRNTDGQASVAAQTDKKTDKPEKKPIARPDPNADYKKFYIILACTSPIWIFLLLAVVTLFLVVLGALALAIVAIIAALVVAVAAGTTLAVVGIVYGITQLFKYAPIGLYEIGLGLKIGGWLMLGGIAAYNIAVRLLPFLIKKLLELFVFTAHKCVELYFYVKGACANL